MAIKVSSVCVGTEPDELNFQKFGKEKGRDETGGTRNMIRRPRADSGALILVSFH